MSGERVSLEGDADDYMIMNEWEEAKRASLDLPGCLRGSAASCRRMRGQALSSRVKALGGKVYF